MFTINTRWSSANLISFARISGPLDSLSAAALTGDETALRRPATVARTLPPDLRKMADGNACAN